MDACIHALDSLCDHHHCRHHHNEQKKNNNIIDYNNVDDHHIHKQREILIWLNALGVFQSHLSALKVIHVTGTKGKGSTCAFVESILRRHPFDLKTGLYTSPHLVSPRERIKINGKSISEEAFVSLFWHVFDAMQSATIRCACTYFGFLTVMGLFCFVRQEVDVAVIEVGIGGRTDLTNIFDNPVVTAVSTLDYDHTEALGETLKEIAREKAGIFKRNVPAFVSPAAAEVLDVFVERAACLNAPLTVVPGFDPPVPLGLEGEFQQLNAALAVALCFFWLEKKMNAAKSTVECLDQSEGLRHCRWMGRAQTLYTKDCRNVTFFLDCAHTPNSIFCCLKWFSFASASSARMLIFYCTPNRDADKLFDPFFNCSGSDLAASFQMVLFVDCDGGRKSDGEEEKASLHVNRLMTKWCCWCSRTASSELEVHNGLKPQVGTASNICEALDVLYRWAAEVRQSDALTMTTVDVLVTGSVRLVGGVLEVLQVDVDDDKST